MPLPNQDTLDPRLAAIVGEIMAVLPAEPPEPPTPAPKSGQSRAEWEADVAAARSAHDAPAEVVALLLAPRAPAVASVLDHDIDVDGGQLTARVYSPEGDGPFPAIVFYHGGAWWLAGGETGFGLTDGFCRIYCAETGSVVVNVDYRLAPEHPYPGQLEDSYAGLVWTVEHASELKVDPANVSVMGQSSGGNQAAAVCLLARERGGPAIRSQTLHAPGLDLTLTSPSIAEDPATLEGLRQVRLLYAREDQFTDGYVSPLLADDLSGLPPAIIITGEHDFIRDDGRRYAARLSEAGVDVRALEYPMLHGVALPETTDQMLADLVAALREVQAATPRAKAVT